MKKIVVLLITIAMLLSLVQAITAVQPGDQDEPIPEQPVSFDISQVFNDGRTISPETVSKMINDLGLYYHTDKEGRVHLSFLRQTFLLVSFEDGEDMWEILNDSSSKKALIERLGYNSNYVDIEYAGRLGSTLSALYGDNVYDFTYTLTSEARELLGTSEMSPIELIYLHTLMLYGESYMVAPLLGGNDYSKTDTFMNDINLDGSFNMKDIAAMKSCIVSNARYYNVDATDQDGDGAMTLQDLKILKNKIANG